jgi:hypothetical protein
MNERIQELAWAAEDYAESIVDQGGGFHQAYTRKFAELIVRECAELAREWEDDYVVEDTAPFHSDVKIKKHFGVEE